MLDAAIVGLGKRGRQLVRSVQNRSDQIRFVRGVTRTPTKLESFTEETGIVIDADLVDVLADPAIPAMVFATPHSQHVEHVVAAAAAGKHVFVEMPLALWGSDAQNACVACKAAEVVLAVGQNWRFLPAFRELTNRLQSGLLGELLHVEANFSGPSGYDYDVENWQASELESPSGGMTGIGMHAVDMMLALMGPVAEVDARSRRQVLTIDMDDTTVALLEFRSGVTGTLATMAATAETWRFQVYGSKGWVEMRGQNQIVMKLIDEDETLTRFEPIDVERLELEAFAEAVEGRASFPVAPEQVVQNIALLEAIGKSNAQQRAFAVPEPHI